MADLPHTYSVSVRGEPNTNLTATVDGLASLEVAPPSQFGGPGDQWSPEDLLMAAVANCFVLSFKAIARATKLNWSVIQCDSKGVLEKQGRTMLFTKVATHVQLSVTSGQNIDAAERALKKAEESCLITNSMTAETQLTFQIIES